MRESGDKTPEDRQPTEQEILSDAAINRELHSRALFNPWTVFLLVPALLAAIDLLILKPIFGDSWTNVLSAGTRRLESPGT